MRLFLIALAAVSMLVISCGSPKDDNSDSGSESNLSMEQKAAIDTTSANYLLLKQQCLICHGGAPSHDKLIAPPMIAVKRRYMMRYNSQEAFEKGMLEWALNPTKEKALMRGAVAEFNVMPKPATPEEDIKKIVKFIYENELQAPDWFEDHYQQMHGSGMGMMKKN